MKNIIFFISLFPSLLFSQQYLPLAVEGNVWSVAYQKFFASGDTILSGKTYKKIYFKELDSTFSMVGTNYLCGIRDSADGRTYFRPRLESTEQVLYDWNLNVGDSILMYTNCYAGSYSFLSSFYNNFIDKDVITNVDSVLIDGIYRKRMTLADNLFFYPFYWVEGIGCLQGLFYNSFVAMNSEIWPLDLFCFHHYDTLMYHNYTYGGDTNNVEDACYYFQTLGIAENAVSKVNVYPNPSHDYLTIQTQSTLIENYQILSLNGKLVTSDIGGAPINIGRLSPGVYFICNEKRTWFRKFIKN